MWPPIVLLSHLFLLMILCNGPSREGGEKENERIYQKSQISLYQVTQLCFGLLCFQEEQRSSWTYRLKLTVTSAFAHYLVVKGDSI